jgi:hypothetical protein
VDRGQPEGLVRRALDPDRVDVAALFTVVVVGDPHRVDVRGVESDLDELAGILGGPDVPPLAAVLGWQRDAT